MRRLSVVEQTAEYLRDGLRKGLWSGTLPGVVPLAASLHVSRGTLLNALRLLEAEGMLAVHGGGHNRTINLHGTQRAKLRMGILPFDQSLYSGPQMSMLLYQIQHELETAGNEVFFSAKSQGQLKHKIASIARHVGKNPADAWLVEAGSRELLEWFAGQPVPCIALYGRSEGLPLARTGPDMLTPFIAATRQLLALGHRRIVVICRRDRRKPTLGNAEQTFVDELTAHGIVPSDYHLPDWKETPEGLTALLKSLFLHNPPTALILYEAPFAISASQFLARRGIKVPEEVSLVSTDYDATLDWCHPPVAHIRWESDPIIRRITRWTNSVRKGVADRRTINFPARFVPAGSVGPVRKDG